MNLAEIARARMRNQHLWSSDLLSPEAVVGSLGAVQAQELGVARWSVGQRAKGVDLAAVNRALDAGTIVRTHTLRPTWHYVRGEDLAWIQDVTGPRVMSLSAYYHRQQGLDRTLFNRANRVITSALQGGNHLTRPELAAALNTAGIPTAGLRMGFIMSVAEVDLVVCSGPARGRHQTYGLVEERVKHSRALNRDEALAELVRRYFTSRGPATLKDFTTWSSLTQAQARAGIAALGSKLEQATWDGRTYWFAPGPDGPASAREPRVDMVQVYDEIVMGYLESRDVMHSPLYGSPLATDRQALLHPLLLDGRMMGRWRRLPRAGGEVLELDLPGPLNAGVAAALDAEVQRYREFAGTAVSVAR